MRRRCVRVVDAHDLVDAALRLFDEVERGPLGGDDRTIHPHQLGIDEGAEALEVRWRRRSGVLRRRAYERSQLLVGILLDAEVGARSDARRGPDAIPRIGAASSLDEFLELRR